MSPIDSIHVLDTLREYQSRLTPRSIESKEREKKDF
jgi:hypothetical protein